MLAARRINSPDEVITRRTDSMRAFADISSRLEPIRARWVNCLLPDSPARGINFPLMHLISVSLDYPDEKFVAELAAGMPIVGHVTSSNVLVRRRRAARSSIESWKKMIPTRNKMNAERVDRSRWSVLSNECRERTLAEIDAGWLSRPTPISLEALESTPRTPRYAMNAKTGPKYV